MTINDCKLCLLECFSLLIFYAFLVVGVGFLSIASFFSAMQFFDYVYFVFGFVIAVYVAQQFEYCYKQIKISDLRRIVFFGILLCFDYLYLKMLANFLIQHEHIINVWLRGYLLGLIVNRNLQKKLVTRKNKK